MMNQDALVRHLKQNTRVLLSPRVEEAFRAVDRRYFVSKELQDEIYEDYPLPIGHNATISQPTTVAFMLEKLDVKEGQKVLDVGSGSGWTTALLAYLVGEKGKVIGLEIVPELVRLGQKNLSKHYSNIPQNIGIENARAEIRKAERGVVGLPSEAPFDPVVDFGIAPKAQTEPVPKFTTGFDRILVSAAADKIPQKLVQQLKPDGVMVIPVGEQHEMQKILRIHKKPDGILETEEYPGFVFVPLR